MSVPQRWKAPIKAAKILGECIVSGTDMFNLSLKEVLENRDFYEVEKGFFGGTRHGEEAERLEYGLHLLRCELFRLRLLEQGLKEDWISRHQPEFVSGVYHAKTSREIIHSNLRRQIEYVRADVIVAAARLKKMQARKK